MKSALFCLTGSLLFTFVINSRTQAQDSSQVPPEVINYLTKAQNSPAMAPDSGGYHTQWVSGGLNTTIVTGEDTHGQYSLFDTLVPPEAGPPLHLHTREDEGFYIVDGDVSIQMDNEVINATPGTYVYSPKNHLHAVRNLTNAPARMVLFYKPSGIENFFDAVGQPVTDPSTPPPSDPKKLLAAAKKYGLEFPSTIVFAHPQYNFNADSTTGAVTVLRTGESKEAAGATIALSDGAAIGSMSPFQRQDLSGRIEQSVVHF